MFIETERLIIRDLELADADGLMKIKNDRRVLEYDPEFIERDADKAVTVKFIESVISNRDSGNFHTVAAGIPRIFEISSPLFLS